MEQSQSTSNFVVWHRKQGHVLKTPIEHLSNHPFDVSLVLVGKFLDQREFPVRHVQVWVDSWFTRGRITVNKEGNLYFFHCREIQDRADILGLYDTMNFRGALLIIKAWKPLDYFKSFNFSVSTLWIKIEGIPLVIFSKSLANLIFSRVGKVLYFDEASGQPGLKKYFRALVWIKIKTPLIPGMYLEMQEVRTIWIDLRYEGVYVFCKRCGRIGHKSSSCSLPWDKAKTAIEQAISNACIPETLVMFGSPNASLYSNKIIGLLHSPEFMTTIVKLDEPRLPPFFNSSSSSSDSDNGGDGTSNSNDEEMQNTSSDQEPRSNGSENDGGANSGPSARLATHGPGYNHMDEGGPSAWAGLRIEPSATKSTPKNLTKTKGKNVLSIKPSSFKKSKRKSRGLIVDAKKILQDTATFAQQPPDGKGIPGHNHHQFLSHDINSLHTHFKPKDSFKVIQPIK